MNISGRAHTINTCLYSKRAHFVMSSRLLTEDFWAYIERSRAYRDGWGGEKHVNAQAFGKKFQIPITWYRWWAMIHCEALEWAWERYYEQYPSDPVAALYPRYKQVFRVPYNHREFLGTPRATSWTTDTELEWWVLVLALVNSHNEQRLHTPPVSEVRWHLSFNALRAKLLEQ